MIDELWDTINGVMGAVEVLVTRVTKALVPEHAACTVLDRKDWNVRKRCNEGSIVCGVSRSIAVVIAYIDVFVSVDVNFVVFVVLERRHGRRERSYDG